MREWCIECIGIEIAHIHHVRQRLVNIVGGEMYRQGNQSAIAKSNTNRNSALRVL